MYVCMYVMWWADIHPALALRPVRSIILFQGIYFDVNNYEKLLEYCVTMNFVIYAAHLVVRYDS